MKRFLSILLVLIFCLGAFVGCDTEQGSSSLENSESDFAEESSSKSDTASETICLEVDENGFPIFKTTKKQYDFYKVNSNSSYNLFYTTVIEDYDAFVTFAEENFSPSQKNPISADIFEENFVVATFRSFYGGDYFLNSSYGDLTPVSSYQGKYALTFEYTKPLMQSDSMKYGVFDLVIIPKSEITTSMLYGTRLKIQLEIIEHTFYTTKATINSSDLSE